MEICTIDLYFRCARPGELSMANHEQKKTARRRKESKNFYFNSNTFDFIISRENCGAIVTNFNAI